MDGPGSPTLVGAYFNLGLEWLLNNSGMAALPGSTASVQQLHCYKRDTTISRNPTRVYTYVGCTQRLEATGSTVARVCTAPQAWHSAVRAADLSAGCVCHMTASHSLLGMQYYEQSTPSAWRGRKAVGFVVVVVVD